MPVTCIVVGCGSRGDRDMVKFYCIPKAVNCPYKPALNELTKKRREKWLAAIKRDDLTEKRIMYQRVCSKHFISGKPSILTMPDDPDWIPTLNMGHTSGGVILKNPIAAVARKKRLEARSQLPIREAVAGTSSSFNSLPMEVDTETGSSTQSDLTMSDITDMMNQLSFVTSKMYDEQRKIQKMSISFDSLLKDSKKCLYYTGLEPYLLKIIFEFIEESITVHSNSVLSASQQLILTLIKLRWNCDFKELAYRFGISNTTAANYFENMIDVLFVRLKGFIIWPDREILRILVPTCFKEAFGDKTTVIIDCFEIFIEKPSNYLTQAQCWSNYKHHTTVKFLIGITPQGTISYISETWGGRISDKQIVEYSNFLNNICPNDVVLADRGFLISDVLGMRRSKLIIPAFTKGKTQLHPMDIEETRQIAHVRIHVERIIGMIKSKFKILKGPIPVSLISNISNNHSVLDKIVIVCCALINLSPSIVPL